MTRNSLDFRATAGGYGEVPPAGAVLGSVYPAAIAGLTVGWSGAITTSDSGATGDARLSGRNFSGSDTKSLRVDLLNGPGTYRIWMGLGALSSTTTTGCRIWDGPQSAAVLLASLPLVSVPGGSVMDATGAIQTTAAWLVASGAYIDVTVANSYLTFSRNGGNLYISNIQIENQVTPLVNAVLTTDTGTGVHSGSIYPKEPARKAFGRVSSASGTQSFTITAGGAYFALESRNGQTWVVATATRIPNAYSGTLTIRQTDGARTKDTSFTMTASTLSRPVTGVLGQVSGATCVERAVTRLVIDAEKWSGYAEQSFASDQAATSPTDLAAKINALTPNGTSWYRIRLQNGTWTGTGYYFSQKDFGTGGLLIEPDTGHDPYIQCQFQSCYLRKCHIRGLKFGPSVAGVGHYNFTGDIPGATPYPLMKFSENRIGAFYGPGFAVANWATWADFIGFEFVEQIIVTNNDFAGMANCSNVTGGRIFSFTNNRYRLGVNDFHALSSAFRFTTPRGVFTDNKTYIEITDCTSWQNADIFGTDYPHQDWLQIRRTTGGVSGAFPVTTAGINGSDTRSWVVGYVGFNPANNKLYDVTAITGDGLLNPAAPPTGTGTGIVSGNVTFAWRQDYTLGTTVYVLMENNCLQASGVSVKTTLDGMPNVQFFINSNSGWNNLLRLTAINNICGSSNIRGLDMGVIEDTLFAEMNTFVGGARKSISNDQAVIAGGDVRAARNIVGVASGAVNVTQTSGTNELNIGVDFQATAAVGTRPGDLLKGAFINLGTPGWGYALVDDNSTSASELRSAMSKQMHPAGGGVAGARLSEVHTVTLSNGAASVQQTVTVNP